MSSGSTKDRPSKGVTAREYRLEEALRAATRLRRAIEREPEPPLQVKALFVPIESVREYDAEIERLKAAK